MNAKAWKTAAKAFKKEIAELQSLLQQAREYIQDTVVPGKDGESVHAPDCMGVYGYRCKSWCLDLQEFLNKLENKSFRRIKFTKEWCAEAAEFEGDSNIGAGALALALSPKNKEDE